MIRILPVVFLLIIRNLVFTSALHSSCILSTLHVYSPCLLFISTLHLYSLSLLSAPTISLYLFFTLYHPPVFSAFYRHTEESLNLHRISQASSRRLTFSRDPMMTFRFRQVSRSSFAFFQSVEDQNHLLEELVM